MLGWLDRFFHSVTGTVGSAVSAVVHYAVHALAAVVFAVFGLVRGAWEWCLSGMVELHTALDDFTKAVVDFAKWLATVALPALRKWAAAALALLAHDLSLLRTWALEQFAKVALAIDRAYRDAVTWVTVHVYDPLKKYADLIAADLRKWGYTAWYYITHPAMLAELLLVPLVTTFEKYAWAIGKMLGQFLLALIAQNIPKLLTLIEDIITAVF